ncbi:MAG: type II toxin-antitoxin system Phd/YefM family antitoxin [Candidatus Binatia bacterium]
MKQQLARQLSGPCAGDPPGSPLPMRVFAIESRAWTFRSWRRRARERLARWFADAYRRVQEYVQMNRYLNVTETRQRLLELVQDVEAGDRVVITKRGTPRAVLVDFERYALLEDMAWLFQDPAKRGAMKDAWERAKKGRGLVKPPRRAAPNVATMRRLVRKGVHRRSVGA